MENDRNNALIFLEQLKIKKMRKQLLCVVIFFVTAIPTQAQLGSLVKKATDKAAKTKTTEPLTNTKLKPMINDEYAVSERGASLYSDEIQIIFSLSPFYNSAGQPSNNFTTSSHIYAKVITQNGTLKDALKIADNDDGIKMYMVLYDDKGDKIKKFVSIAETFEISSAQANSKSITLDILPDPSIFTSGKQSDFYVGAAFAYGHNEYTFPRNGNYKVGLFIKNEKVDDWGKPVYGDDIIFANFFNYNFMVKDAAAIVKESQTLSEIKNNAQKNAITALPTQWAEKSSALVMGFTQAQLVTMYQNSFTSKMDAHTVVKFHASPSNGGYTVVNNEYGIPIYRYSNQWYTIFIKYANGKTCFYQGFGLRQQYNGGGTYGKPFVDKNEYHMVDCSTMK